MRPTLRRVVLALALLAGLAGAASLPAQDGKLRYRRLVWEDFPVDDRTRPDLDAWTHSGIDYTYRARYVPRRGQYLATVAQIRFAGYFDPSRSWRKSRIRANPELLLEHEQGHFDVNELTVRRLQRAGLESYPIGVGPDSRAAVDDLDQIMRAWFDARIGELQQEHARYDEETDHGRRRGKQADWTRALQSNLRATEASPAQPSAPLR